MILSKQNIIDLLKQIPDPEVPVINIIELGVVREISILENLVEVEITPTYTGCPAMKMIEDQIIELLHQESGKEIKVKMIYSPAWTTDWITEEAKNKLLDYGIAPPEKTSVDKSILLSGGVKIIKCPQCKSENTGMISQFGSTACKALYKCMDCLEPFDYFKCI